MRVDGLPLHARFWASDVSLLESGRVPTVGSSNDIPFIACFQLSLLSRCNSIPSRDPIWHVLQYVYRIAFICITISFYDITRYLFLLISPTILSTCFSFPTTPSLLTFLFCDAVFHFRCLCIYICCGAGGSSLLSLTSRPFKSRCFCASTFYFFFLLLSLSSWSIGSSDCSSLFSYACGAACKQSL